MHIELTPSDKLLWNRVKTAIERWHGGPMTDTTAFMWLIYQTVADAHKTPTGTAPATDVPQKGD